MQRLIITATAIVLVFATGLNAALLVQNNQLRQQVINARAQQVAQPNPNQANEIQQLKERLDRAEQDRVKATRDATDLRNQIGRLESAATDREKLKGEVETLQQENEQLRNQVINLQSMNEINAQVTELRGLAPINSVQREFMNQSQLRDYLVESLERDFSAEAEQQQRAILQALDMDYYGDDLRQAQIESSVRSILGFYNQESKHLVIVTNRARMGVRDRVTYAHEFTHNLQDQHYNLTALFNRAAGNSDHQMAIRALVEGDATLTMALYAQQHLTAMDMTQYQLEQVRDFDLSGLFSGGYGPLTESAAAFPYQEGTTFVGTLYHNGGWAAVTRAFSNPPRSTEQVLHPEKYFNGDEPIAVRLPNLQSALGGTWQTITDDTLGELYLRIYLQSYLSFEQSIPAGIGWGGDRYQVFSNSDGAVALALQTTWDTQRDAQEFFNAYSTFVTYKARGTPNVLQSSPTQMRWQLSGQQYYLSITGSRVLVLHAPSGTELDALIRQFPGF